MPENTSIRTDLRPTGPEAGAPHAGSLRKPSLDKDLGRLGSLESAAHDVASGLVAPGLALLFLVLAGIAAIAIAGGQPNAAFIVIAAVLGGYMALNIGANDVANNVAPAVGARALTMLGALAIAAVCESAGALIAGGDVVETISKDIVKPERVADTNLFISAMIATLFASALWVHLATYIGAPVSTTHAVVGAVLGAGVAAAGLDAVNWSVMGAIAVSWIVSPVLGGAVAVLFLAFIKIKIIYQDDKIGAARRWVPALIALMVASFLCYLILKGLAGIWSPSALTIAVLGVAAYFASLVPLRSWIRRKSEDMENRNASLRALFHLPLICSAALLSFAHGANDVANAVGPLAAVVHAAKQGGVAAEVGVPFWVMVTGAFGISLGLFLYGPRLVRMVGEQITKMNPMRAYCVALSAAITVLLASAMGLPVSSTHIAVGAVFGVGFFREYWTAHSSLRQRYMQRRGGLMSDYDDDGKPENAETQRRKLVRRRHFLTIIAAWIVTVPVTALLAATVFGLINLFR